MCRKECTHDLFLREVFYLMIIYDHVKFSIMLNRILPGRSVGKVRPVTRRLTKILTSTAVRLATGRISGGMLYTPLTDAGKAGAHSSSSYNKNWDLRNYFEDRTIIIIVG